ncbi:hypothetical protein Taro_052042 [Colocasia esculenta]|uniref:Uncharacterized protein n=1 Tax=Colocasia esculenta TaxID=4460 RepID=A0A843XIH3_COLES|nr:hypothetical protein [Colocasia esculenta]
MRISRLSRHNYFSASVMGEETHWRAVQHATDNLAQSLERVVPVDNQGKMELHKDISSTNSQETVSITVSIHKKTVLPNNRRTAGKQRMKQSKKKKKTKKANKQANVKAQPKESHFWKWNQRLSTDRKYLSTGTVPKPEIDFWMPSPVDSHLLGVDNHCSVQCSNTFLYPVTTILEGGTSGYVYGETNLDDILLLRL